MEATRIEILDLKEIDGSIAASSCSYCTQVSGETTRVRWDASRQPNGWKSLKGILFAEPQVGWQCNPASVIPTDLGGGSFEFFDDCHPGGLLVGLILPKGFTIQDIRSLNPVPHGVKVFKGRLAILWKLAEKQTLIAWDMQKADLDDLIGRSAQLNRQIKDARIAPIETTVVIEASGSMEDDTLDELEDEEPDPKSDYLPIPTKSPQGATEWLLTAVAKVPNLKYALGAVGLVAAAAISSGFFFGNSTAALYGAVAALVAAVLVRIYAEIAPAQKEIDISLPIKVIVWTCVVAFVLIVALGLSKLVLAAFPSVASATANSTKQAEKSDTSRRDFPRDLPKTIAEVIERVERDTGARFDWKITQSGPEAWAISTKQLAINPDLLSKLTESSVYFVLAREIGHINLGHTTLDPRITLGNDMAADNFAVEQMSRAGFASTTILESAVAPIRGPDRTRINYTATKRLASIATRLSLEQFPIDLSK